MSPNTYLWLKAIHLFGVYMWMGTMIGLSHTLAAHADADLGARPAFHKLERKIAIMMDIGATLSISIGLFLLFKLEPSPLKQGGYMHAKLGLVFLGVLLPHGLLRAKVRKFREGKVVPLPGLVPPLLSLVALTILILVVVRPM